MTRMLPETMLAMAAEPGTGRVTAVRKPIPRPAKGEVLVRVRACGVCRTDLHIVDADLPPHVDHVVPGHEIVGEVVECGPGADRFALGARVGIPWLGRTCGRCDFCRMQRENLCDEPLFTGYDRDGGYAEYAVADESFCFALPDTYDDVHAAPLLCAGLIGFRTWRIAGGRKPQHIGLYGFGAAAHIVCQFASAQGQSVYAFTRSGDERGQAFARSLGAVWAGASDEQPPHALDAALIFAPTGLLVPAALEAVRKGGAVVCGGIHMSDIPSFPYRLLWGERDVRSVANLTREDGDAFFSMLATMQVRTEVHPYPLAHANEALEAVRSGAIDGAAVLVP